MEKVIRNVRDIDRADRQALEHVLGQSLRENQQVVIGIVNLDMTETSATEMPPRNSSGGALPDWCNVYDGLTDEEIADLEKVILTRADLSRPSE
jgi:hypothetical protein